MMKEESESTQINGVKEVENNASTEEAEESTKISHKTENGKEKAKVKNEKSAADGPKSKVIIFTSSGSMEKIALKEETIPTVHKEEILVKIKYAGINFMDILRKMGSYPSTSFPMVSGIEASGIVEAIGSDVNNFKAGDRVLLFRSEGLFREVVCINQNSALLIPDEITFEDAASLFVNYITAYDLLFKMGNLKPKQTILLPQASGGVGHAVIQLAKTVPDVQIIALASKAKHEHLKSLGVQHVVDYKAQNYVEEVKRISPKGVDLALDSLNGEDSTHFFNLLRPLGRVIHYGFCNSSGERTTFKLFKGWLKCLSLNSLKIVHTNKMMGGYHLNTLLESDPDSCKESFKELTKLYREGKVKPCIDSIFPFTMAKEAFSRLSKRQNVGKVLLAPNETEMKIFNEQPSKNE